MIYTAPQYTKERERSDMADLEVLGSISFDLNINKDESIKKAFISLVGKLGTREFLEEYSQLYTTLLRISSEREAQKIFNVDGIDFSNTLFYTNTLPEDTLLYSTASDTPTKKDNIYLEPIENTLDTFLFPEENLFTSVPNTKETDQKLQDLFIVLQEISISTEGINYEKEIF
ncbi:hypothetical protein NEOKW01_0092 [Nematocida sp. AWRm80]|nr:hypothetical protein NEOKW01_0092 [Nematocida sp. AWRm80]